MKELVVDRLLPLLLSLCLTISVWSVSRVSVGMLLAVFTTLSLCVLITGQITTSPRDQPKTLHLHGIENCCQYQDDPLKLLDCSNHSSYRNLHTVIRNLRANGGPTLG